jgi:hypothetical protein
MGMAPPDFLTAFVEGNYDDCVENPGCLRRAFNAAVSASHLADHYYEYHQRHNPQRLAQYPTLRPFVEYVVERTNQRFKDIRSISNAYKHLYENKRKRRDHADYWSISSAGSIDCVTFEGTSYSIKTLEHDFDTSEGVQSVSRIMFRRRDGSPSCAEDSPRLLVSGGVSR